MSRQVVLFTPGDERRMVEKSLTSDADMVILDIEDAVAPSAKEKACETVRDTLNEWDTTNVEVETTVRINPLEDRGEADLEILADAGEHIENVVLPKVREPGDLKELTNLLVDLEFDANLMPLIETPEAMVNLFDIANFPRVEAMEFGAEDFTTEVGGTNTESRHEVTYGRQRLVVAAAAAEVDAIDMAWPDFRDVEGLRRNTQQAVEMGYDGKSVIHPGQIDVVRDVFTPDTDQVEWARNVLEAAEEAEDRGKVVFQLEGEMIDPPIIARAQDIVERIEMAE